MPPDSRTIQSSISGACSISRSPARRRIAARSSNEVCAHSGCAAAAARAASRTSSPSAMPIVPSSSPVAGSITGAVPPDAGRQLPANSESDQDVVSSRLMRVVSSERVRIANVRALL